MVEELLNRLRLEGIVPERLTVIRTATESTVRDWRGEGMASPVENGTGRGTSRRSRFRAVAVEWGLVIAVGLWLVGSLTGALVTREVGESLGIAVLLGLAAVLIRAAWRHFRSSTQHSPRAQRERSETIPGGDGPGKDGGEWSRWNGRVIVAMRLEGARRPELEKIVQATGGKPLAPGNPADNPNG